MEDNKNSNKSEPKALALKALKIGIFAGLGYMAAGPLGALVGLILAMAKA